MGRFFVFVFFISISFFSCSNAASVQEPESVEENDTLKNFISQRGAGVSWTGELEGDRLLFDVYRDIEHIVSDVALSPNVVNVAYDDFPDGVYPELIGFGSLDLKGLPSEIRVFVNDFCRALSENIYDGPQKFFDDKYMFNYVFFRNDLIGDWEKYFGCDFPQVADDGDDAGNDTADEKGGDADGVRADENKNTDDVDSDDAGVADNDDVKNNDDIKPAVKKVYPPLFKKWRLGAPVNSGEILQQPVRFYCNQGYVDFVLYIRLDNNKIYQISRGVYGR